MKSRILFAVLVALAGVSSASAQDGRETDPAAALTSALNAACRGNETMFANYLTADNAAAFKALPQDQRTQFLERFWLSDQPGRPLISADDKNHTVVRCVDPAGTAEFRFGDARVADQLVAMQRAIPSGDRCSLGVASGFDVCRDE